MTVRKCCVFFLYGFTVLCGVLLNPFRVLGMRGGFDPGFGSLFQDAQPRRLCYTLFTAFGVRHI